MENPGEQVNSDVNPEALKAFSMMWDCFPAVVMLLRKNRTIVGLNKVARDVGIQLGTKCYQLTGETAIHAYSDGLFQGFSRNLIDVWKATVTVISDGEVAQLFETGHGTSRPKL